jgi:arabinan endo-1,5-alpha-L-arabinosidase
LRSAKPLALLAATSLCASLLAGCASGPTAATDIPATGSVDVHDPALIIDDAGTPETDDDTWYVYSTGNGSIGLGSPQVRRSTDHGKTWEYIGAAWKNTDEPYWARSIIEGVDNFWAPEVYEHDGTYYMYYSASTFGSNTSLIGLYTNTTLDVDSPDYRWVDHGEVLRSNGGRNFNAIDPGIVEDENGDPWMVFGSFWGGLHLVPLEWPSGKLPGMADVTDDPLTASGIEPVLVADRGYPPNSIEAGYILRHGEYYYLFFSRDSCCQGSVSTYNMAVGRSENITGPYVDADGVSLLEDGGTQLLKTVDTRVGPGGQSVAVSGASGSGDAGTAVVAYHFYDKDKQGLFQLGLRELAWTEDGWPVAWTEEELPE